MTQDKARKWIVAAHFFSGSHDRWLDDFIVDENLEFRKVAPPKRSQNWHTRKALVTPLSDWMAHLRHAWSAMRGKPTGVIVCFPQLAMCAALLKLLLRQDVRIIAYNFNLGALPGGARRRLARLVARQIDRFVVHSPLEVKDYAEYLGVAPSKVTFTPLQRGTIDVPRDEDTREPYLLAMGSAHRDYAALIAAADDLQIRTIIVTRPEMIQALPRSPHVNFLSNLSEQQCYELMARARVSVTPVVNQKTASGQVTFLTAMQLGVPIIATRCPGTVGYIEHGRTGILVEPADYAGLKTAIESLWTNPKVRSDLAREARAESIERFSDTAAANSLLRIIREVAGGPPPSLPATPSAR